MCALEPGGSRSAAWTSWIWRSPPTFLPPFLIAEAAYWHPMRNSDPAVTWLRELLYDIAIELETAG
jgi:hypothetical protein